MATESGPGKHTRRRSLFPWREGVEAAQPHQMDELRRLREALDITRRTLRTANEREVRLREELARSRVAADAAGGAAKQAEQELDRANQAYARTRELHDEEQSRLRSHLAKAQSEVAGLRELLAHADARARDADALREQCLILTNRCQRLETEAEQHCPELAQEREAGALQLERVRAASLLRLWLTRREASRLSAGAESVVTPREEERPWPTAEPIDEATPLVEVDEPYIVSTLMPEVPAGSAQTCAPEPAGPAIVAFEEGRDSYTEAIAAALRHAVESERVRQQGESNLESATGPSVSQAPGAARRRETEGASGKASESADRDEIVEPPLPSPLDLPWDEVDFDLLPSIPPKPTLFPCLTEWESLPQAPRQLD